MTVYSAFQFSGKLGTQFNLLFSSDLFGNVNEDIYKPRLLDNEKLIDGRYYFYIPMTISQSCGIGEYFDGSRFNHLI